MRVLPLFFTAYLNSRIPCHPLYLSWSLHRVVPQSLVPQLRNASHNLIPFPQSMNIAQGFTDHNGTEIVYACSKCPFPGYCRGAARVGEFGINPPDALKGVVARSVLYSVGMYPKHSKLIHSQVLDLDVAIKWDRLFPMSLAERDYYISNSKSE